MTDNTYNRRAFIGLSGAGLAGAAGALRPVSTFASQSEPSPLYADYIVTNAKVYTVDALRPTAEAFAVRGDRFVAVGNNSEVKQLAGRGTKVVDAAGATVVPGFIDCHNHADGETLVYDVLVGNPFEVEFVTIASIVDKLRKRAAETPPGTWVDGYFFDDTKVRDKRPLTAADLDGVSMQHPVAVHHRGGHTTYFNNYALKKAGLTKNTPNPPGGTYDRDEHGELNGRVTDRAREIFRNVGEQPKYTSEERAQRSRAGLAFISKAFVRYGLTSVHHEEGDLFALQQVRAEGNLKHRVSFETSGATLEAMIANGIRTGFGDEWIRFGATAEHTADGSFSERTMSLSIPYPGRKPPYQGNLTETQEVLNPWVERVHRAGIQINCHANGDVAIAEVLTAFERAQAAFPRKDARPKITHCTLINDDLLRRIKAAGAIPTPFTSYAYYNSDKFHFYGEELMKRSMAFRSFLDAGIPAAAGSDFSPGPFSPLMGIQGMVTRTGWNGETWGANQRVTVDEAIRINTLHGAYASHEEALKGSITPGKLADYVVLAEDPHAVDPGKIKDIRIVRTVTGGATTYEA